MTRRWPRRGAAERRPVLVLQRRPREVAARRAWVGQRAWAGAWIQGPQAVPAVRRARSIRAAAEFRDRRTPRVVPRVQGASLAQVVGMQTRAAHPARVAQEERRQALRATEATRTWT